RLRHRRTSFGLENEWFLVDRRRRRSRRDDRLRRNGRRWLWQHQRQRDTGGRHLQIGGRPYHVLRVDDRRTRPGRLEQSAVANQVHDSRNTAGSRRHALDGLFGEFHPAVVAGDGEPVRDIGLDFLRRQRNELAPKRHTLSELTHFGRRQTLVQLWLPDEHHLEQLLAILLQIRKDPNLFEQVGPQVVCLVDHDDRKRLQQLERREEVVERVAQIGAAGAPQTS